MKSPRPKGLARSVSGVTLLEVLVASVIMALLALFTVSYVISTKQFVDSEESSMPADQELTNLLATLRTDLYESSGVYSATGSPCVGSYSGFPPQAVAQNQPFPSPATAATGNYYSDVNAPCNGIIIYKDYPRSTVTPMAILYQTKCVGLASGQTIDYADPTFPNFQPGLSAPTTTGAGAGLNCAPSQVPVVYRSQWTNFPSGSFPASNSVITEGTTVGLNYFWNGTGPYDTSNANFTNAIPTLKLLGGGVVLPTGKAAGVGLCVKFVNEAGPCPTHMDYVLLEVSAIYLKTANKFGVVRKSLHVPLIMRGVGATLVAPVSQTCGTSGC